MQNYEQKHLWKYNIVKKKNTERTKYRKHNYDSSVQVSLQQSCNVLWKIPVNSSPKNTKAEHNSQIHLNVQAKKLCFSMSFVEL